MVIRDIGKWSRIIPLDPKEKQKEIWILKNSQGEKHYDVEVTLGKPIDILKLKVEMVENFNEKVITIRKTRIETYKKKLVDLSTCPICNSNLIINSFSVNNANYFQCENCTHHFIKERPTKEALEVFYSSDRSYQGTYASKRTTETRIQQVAIPKAKWAIRQFERIYGRKPKSILDVGAGSGHFVYACKTLGIECDGIEINKNGVNFCRENLGIELLTDDFNKNWSKYCNYDIITLWGVIEHVSNPLGMLQSTSKALINGGLVIASVPRWNSFSTVVQFNFSDSIIRHLDPLGHIHIFTDESLATTFDLCDIKIIAAWYYGMDAYELFTQLSYFFQNDEIIQKSRTLIPSFQKFIDLAKLSDEIVLAGNINKKK